MSLPPGVDPCSVPAAKNPDGSPPNFVDPVDLSVQTLAVGAVFASISTVCFVTRIYANFNKMKWADYLTIVGFILSTSYSGVIMAMHKYSRHQWDLPACWYVTNYVWKLIFGQNIMLGPTQFFVKTAILAVYFQIFATTKTMRWVIYSGVIFCGLIYLPHPIIVSIFNVPYSGEQWRDLATNGRPQKIAFYAPIHGFGSVILDIFILIVPLSIVSKLQVSRKKRFQLMAVFAMGLLGIISSIISCYWRMDILISKSDYTWKQAQLFIWIMIEHDIALIVGSMPAVAAFFRAHFGQTGLFSLLLSKTFGSISFSKKSSRGESEASLDMHDVNHKGTHSGHRPRSNYYEISDSSFDMRTNVSASMPRGPQNYSLPHPVDAANGIVRTTEISQNTILPIQKPDA